MWAWSRENIDRILSLPFPDTDRLEAWAEWNKEFNVDRNAAHTAKFGRGLYYLSPQQALDALDQHECRWFKEYSLHWKEWEAQPKIFFNNRWMRLSRTDLMDHIATGVSAGSTPFCSNDELRELWKRKVWMGARYTDRDRHNYFAPIDSWSDG